MQAHYVTFTSQPPSPSLSLSLRIVYAFSAAPSWAVWTDPVIILWETNPLRPLPSPSPLQTHSTGHTILNYSAPKLWKLVSTKDTEESSQKLPHPPKKKKKKEKSPILGLPSISRHTSKSKGAESSRVPGIPLNIRGLGARPLSVPFSWSPNSLRTPQGRDNQIN